MILTLSRFFRKRTRRGRDEGEKNLEEASEKSTKEGKRRTSREKNQKGKRENNYGRKEERVGRQLPYLLGGSRKLGDPSQEVLKRFSKINRNSSPSTVNLRWENRRGDLYYIQSLRIRSTKGGRKMAGGEKKEGR